MTEVTIHNHKMSLDDSDRVLSRRLREGKEYAPAERKLIESKVKAGYKVLDLGAHIGYYTLIMARLVGDTGKVYAYEPDIDNYNLLCKNVRLNGYQNIVTIHGAVSDRTSEALLYRNQSGNTGDHRLGKNKNGMSGEKITTFRIDDCYKEMDFVKMCVQGWDWRAVSGMTDLLERNKNIKVVNRFLWDSDDTSKEYLLGYFELWDEWGFKIYYLNKHTGNLALVNPEKARSILEKANPNTARQATFYYER